MPRILAPAVLAGLLVCAAPAGATEGPPGGPPLPNTLQPVTFTPAPPGAKPRVLRARLVPRRVKHGRRARLLLHLKVPGRVQVTVRRAGRRVSTRALNARGLNLKLRTSRRLRPGRYRITIVLTDAAGNRSRAVHRTLVVTRR